MRVRTRTLVRFTAIALSSVLASLSSEVVGTAAAQSPSPLLPPTAEGLELPLKRPVILPQQIAFQDDEPTGKGQVELIRRSLSKDAQPVIVEFAPTAVLKTSGDDIVAAPQKAELVRSLGISPDDVLHDYTHLPMLTLRLHGVEELDRLASRPEVTGIYEDGLRRRQLVQSLPLIEQPQARAGGYGGSGSTVAVIDTGVDYTRAAFGLCTAPGVPAGCKVVASIEFAPADGRLDDVDFHGTNVAAIAIGVAPDARVAALDVFNGEFASDSFILAAINWALANQSTYNIVALNLSLGSGEYQRPCGGAYATPFASARAAGILPVVASGNDGSTSGIASPACVHGAVSVGAVYDSNVGQVSTDGCTDSLTSADKVTCFSNSASYLTLLAPGALIAASGFTYAGTSQAAPHVAGAVAVLRSAFPTERTYLTLRRLVDVSSQVSDWRDGRPKPRLNLYRAIYGPFSNCTSQSLSIGSSFTASLSSRDCHAEGADGIDIYYNDLYSFSGTAGQTVTIQTNSGGLYTWLGLVAPSNPNSYAATTNATAGSTRSSAITFTLTESGTWRIDASSAYGGETGAYALSLTQGGGATSCTPGGATLCLNAGRFRVQVNWRVQSQGTAGSGSAVSLSGDTGYFWFFTNGNVELVVKVLDGRPLNGRFWVFYGALSDVEYTLTVTDTLSGAVRTYSNPQGRLASVADTSAF